MPITAIDGRLEIEIAGQNFWLIGQTDIVEVHFPSLLALQTVRKCLMTPKGQAPLWWPYLQKLLNLVDLRVFIATRMVARAGRHATPNAIGRSLGWEGVEVFPLAAAASWWHGTPNP